ncbi:histidine phosphatase family protein [Exiguobacterium sp. KRL4]|uniref:histidine phosphatase family protein n=1 Tax=Exiguobacterium sp. KRL4 TaxID=1914536 RepID=UPI0008F8B9C6|nr:histidine phosphatase family protein [Exiguobacterium sp. KRL4]OIN67653.1 histidine phosphatase family protein [Exiguobacterium sp. KRL4]
MKTYYVIRHCEATGQAPDAPLTKQGQKQADALAVFFKTIPVDRILCSPFRRARETILPLAALHDCSVEIEDQLQERTLSTSPLSDWRTALQETFVDLDLRFPDGESSREVMERMTSILKEASLHPARHTILVTHGNAMALLLHTIDSTFGYEDWQQLQNPDVYRLVQTAEGMTCEWMPLHQTKT